MIKLEELALNLVEIFTDGACSKNPGPGGWGAIIHQNNETQELSGFEPNTTNNRMEILAAIKGLEILKHPSRVRLYTDSKYLLNGISIWITQWKSRGWRTADNKPVKNIDLWQKLETITQRHRVEWIWIKGHAGHPENERADFLATNVIKDHIL